VLKGGEITGEEDCEQLWQNEPKAEVTPRGMWPHATEGEVKTQGNPILPIVRIPTCPATVRVNRNEFPNGAILLNDSPIPYNTRPYELRVVVSSGSFEDVILWNNVGWPYCNKVLLWK
jgi:hypothetical protein